MFDTGIFDEKVQNKFFSWGKKKKSFHPLNIPFFFFNSKNFGPLKVFSRTINKWRKNDCFEINHMDKEF